MWICKLVTKKFILCALICASKQEITLKMKTNFCLYTQCKMHRTPVLLKKYSFHNFLSRSNFAFV